MSTNTKSRRIDGINRFANYQNLKYNNRWFILARNITPNPLPYFKDKLSINDASCH